MNVVRLVHEAATQRQHVRVRMPAQATIKGVDYPAFDWSVGGFSIADTPLGLAVGQTTPVGLTFAFDGFKFTLDVTGQVRYIDAERRRAGLQFIDPSENDLSLLQFLVGSYMSGEIVQAADLLAIVRRDNSAKARGGAGKAVEIQKVPLLRQMAANGKRIILLTGLWAAVAGVFFMIGSSAYNRLFLVKGLAAVTSPEASVVSAPRTGLLLPFKLERGAHVSPRQTLMKIELGEGKTANVQSACDCIVAEAPAKGGQFVQKGAPLLTLAPVKGRLAVQAHIALEDTSRVQVGDRATVFLLSERRTVRGEVLRVEVPGVGPTALSGATPMMGDRLQAIVTIRLDHKLPVDAVGQAATATIRTFALNLPFGLGQR
jgi:alginate biosynthesis protein Alg44